MASVSLLGSQNKEMNRQFLLSSDTESARGERQEIKETIELNAGCGGTLKKVMRISIGVISGKTL